MKSPEIYGSVFEKIARKKYAAEKTQGGWLPSPLVIGGLILYVA